MSEKASDDGRDAVTREAEEQSAATLETIGKHLQFRLAGIVTQPLPEKMAVLLGELKQGATGTAIGTRPR